MTALLLILFLLGPPVLSGLLFARVRLNVTTSTRCRLAYFGAAAFSALLEFLPHALMGNAPVGLLYAVLGFFRIHIVFSFVAIPVCWLAMPRKRTLPTRDI